MDIRDLIVGALLYFLFPLWLLAGVGDYICHRRTGIERTSGVGESALHVLQAIEVGVPLVAGLFFEINALVLAIMATGVTAHMLTALWDGFYTSKLRRISPLEQHIHSHLEYVPLVALLLLSLLYWDQVRALFGFSAGLHSFTLEPKRQPIDPGYIVAVLAPIVLLQGGLLVEEFIRTLRYARRQGKRAASVT
jgi:hypothetical protein